MNFFQLPDEVSTGVLPQLLSVDVGREVLPDQPLVPAARHHQWQIVSVPSVTEIYTITDRKLRYLITCIGRLR